TAGVDEVLEVRAVLVEHREFRILQVVPEMVGGTDKDEPGLRQGDRPQRFACGIDRLRDPAAEVCVQVRGTLDEDDVPAAPGQVALGERGNNGTGHEPRASCTGDELRVRTHYHECLRRLGDVGQDGVEHVLHVQPCLLVRSAGAEVVTM